MENILLGTENTKQGWRNFPKDLPVTCYWAGIFFSLCRWMKYNICPLETHIILKISEISMISEILRVWLECFESQGKVFLILPVESRRASQRRHYLRHYLEFVCLRQTFKNAGDFKRQKKLAGDIPDTWSPSEYESFLSIKNSNLLYGKPELLWEEIKGEGIGSEGLS